MMDNPNISGCRVCTDFKTWTHEKKDEEKQARINNKSLHVTGSSSGRNLDSNVDKLPCPPDSQELGSSTWTFLHTMASYFPDKPTADEKEAAKTLINSLSILYPCSYCAKHMREELQKKPASAETRTELERWLCNLHNEVNERLGKSLFDCSRVRERWKDGPANGSCG